MRLKVMSTAALVTVVCALSAAAQVGGDGIRLMPTPDGVACVGSVTADGHTWTCEDAMALAQARVADPNAPAATLPGDVEKVVSGLAQHLRAGGQP